MNQYFRGEIFFMTNFDILSTLVLFVQIKGNNKNCVCLLLLI